MVVLDKSAQDGVLHPGTESLTVYFVVDRNSRFPNHNTTKHAVVLVLGDQSVRILGDKVVGLLGGEGIRAGW